MLPQIGDICCHLDTGSQIYELKEKEKEKKTVATWISVRFVVQEGRKNCWIEYLGVSDHAWVQWDLCNWKTTYNCSCMSWTKQQIN